MNARRPAPADSWGRIALLLLFYLVACGGAALWLVWRRISAGAGC